MTSSQACKVTGSQTLKMKPLTVKEIKTSKFLNRRQVSLQFYDGSAIVLREGDALELTFHVAF